MATPSDGNRPSGQEIYKKVSNALVAIQQGRRYFGVEKHLSSDFEALEVSSEPELWDVLPILLEEIKHAIPANCYVGGHPPYRSYDEEMKDMELWPYRWNSPSQGKMMFLEFALERDKKGDWWYVHEDRPEGRV
jgi:hypothetical protein